MDIHLSAETMTLIAQVALAVIAAGIVVTKLIDGLRKAGHIKDGDAGEWNQAISFFVTLATFVIRWFGFEKGLPGAEQLGIELSAILVTSFTVSVVAKALHYIVEWMKGRQIAAKSG